MKFNLQNINKNNIKTILTSRNNNNKWKSIFAYSKKNPNILIKFSAN